MAIVQLDHIRKVYDTKVAVEDLSLSVDAGMMFGLLGPNGSGKTSSIRMMIGMTLPDSGLVSLFGKPFTRGVLWRVGYLPEERGLYKKMNVLEQLVFLGQLRGISEAEARRRSRNWCEKLQITEAMPKKTEDLSKGMQQKIQFIASLLHNPDLIIMDEPFSGLDPVSAALLMDTLVELRSQGKAVLFSTHRMDQVEKLCDAIALIHRGQLVVSGTMQEVKSAYPRNRVQISFEGDDGFLRHPAIASVKRYPGQVEITMRPSQTLTEDTQLLLAEAMRCARLTRFEVSEPTLEDIFIEKVGQSSPEDLAELAMRQNAVGGEADA
ncbi:MAG TPA: ATP-binding cassette domain-containing protein [Acidobacteriaceae bacterium]|nr:ATP-binding cassette domain-containing protein [Acidobacteriaceae bacterium]